MKIKKMFFSLVLLISLTFICHAQLGTNPRGNVLEYGKPAREYVASGYLVQIFERNALQYEIFYESKAKAVLVRVFAPGDTKTGLSNDEISRILVKNSEQSKWISKSADNRPGFKIWEREDGKAFAELDNASGVMSVAYRSVIPERVQINPDNWTPYQLCLSGSFAFPARQCVYGLKAGFMSGQGRVVGVEASAIAATTPEVYGLKGSMVNVGDGSRGIHLGVVNVESDFNGMQAGLVNVLSGKIPGTLPPDAFQFGLVNYARDLDGFQFGLVNIVDNGSIPFMVIFNFDSP